jgi:3-hydroxyisobutyrate dehydrogenase
MNVGFIGLGAMGRGIAWNLHKAGFSLIVNDVDPSATDAFLHQGISVAESPAEIARASDAVFTCVPGPAEIEVVLDGPGGMNGQFRDGAAWFEMSTSSVELARSISARLHEQDVFFFDAPVSGGVGGAVSGELAVWVGGNEGAFNKFRVTLDAIADQVRYLGPNGAGLTAKLAHNMASFAINAIVSEVMSLGMKAGLEPGALWDALRTGAAGRNRTFDGVAHGFMRGRTDASDYRLTQVAKDVELALKFAHEHKVPMRLASLVQEEITEALNRGWGSEQGQGYMRLQQERAAVPTVMLSEERVNTILERS